MNKWMMVLAALLLASGPSFAQAPSTWPCSDEVTKSDGDNHRIRVSTGVSAVFAEKKADPDISDLRGRKIDSTVVVRILIDKSGAVRCADAIKGDANLYQRSQNPAMQGHSKPYLLNGQPIVVETWREFVFKKNKVDAR